MAPGSGWPHEASKCEERDDDDDPLFYVDNQAVDDLLRELAEEGLDGQPGWLASDGNQIVDEDEFAILALPEIPQSLGDESGEGIDNGDGESPDHSRQVDDLLRSLAETKIMHDKTADDQEASDSDDSDGESMNREIRRVLAQAKDEVDTAQRRGIDELKTDDDGIDKVSTLSGQNAPDREDASIMSRSKPPRKDNDHENNPLGLPTVPNDLVEPPPPSIKDTSDHLGLPSVPTEDLPKRGDDDDISARLAALRGLQGKATGLGQTDAFGLPSAPSFRPGEEEGGVLKRGHYGHGRRNYTTDDMNAWCIVCLEDATVRCLGCADSNGGDESTDQNNAYCMGCWRDMHVGPAAGFDERGHKRVPLLR
ncbi:hypothetical protein SEPCBS57363_001050 [Sporothrix epigloea]|uniref:Uncharacterized protein n=1 Tax=Sporothrix epigloea TaxID=1892477 RepID=A0ABP0DB30_9PEZI